VSQHIIAVDIDYRRVHAWSSKHGRVAYKASVYDLVTKLYDLKPDLVLVEVAAPIAYRGAARGSQLKWFIYNSYAAGILLTLYTGKTLVSPSSSWTLSYPEKVRHALAKTTATNHDLRECETMIWFYQQHPRKWREHAEYFTNL